MAKIACCKKERRSLPKPGGIDISLASSCKLADPLVNTLQPIPFQTHQSAFLEALRLSYKEFFKNAMVFCKNKAATAGYRLFLDLTASFFMPKPVIEVKSADGQQIYITL